MDRIAFNAINNGSHYEANHGSTAGALIFWLYIVAALTFTFAILYTITHDATSMQAKGLKKGKILFTCLAVISFTCLSYNMMHVLILSYLDWEAVHKPSTPLRFTNLSPSLAPPDIVRRLWHWSITTTPFQDFGQALVADKAGWKWSQAALLLTLAQTTMMGFEGRVLGIPRLWMFFVLAEILPISFTQNLFYLACLPRVAERDRRRLKYSWSGAVLQGLFFVAYVQCVLYAPRSGESLMTVILVARALLLGPLLLPLGFDVVTKTGKDGSQRSEVGDRTAVEWSSGNKNSVLLIAAGLVGAMLLYSYVSDLVRNVSGLDYHPAVSALGYDFIISVISTICWSYTRLTRPMAGKDWQKH